MTGGGGGLLGLRTSSYGSLLQQQQMQNGGGGQLLLPVQSTSLVTRKASKLLLAGSREKERLLPWICKIVGRRKVGMLLLAIVSILVFLSILSASSKEYNPEHGSNSEEDSSEGPETNWQLSQTFFSTEQSNPEIVKASQFSAEDMLAFKVSLQNESKVQFQPLSINASMFPSRHPCEDVILPTPPIGTKRTGFRPCEVCYVSVEHAMALMPSMPSQSPVLQNLNYFSEENSYMNESNGGSLFSGRPSLQQREESFHIRDSMTVHCGFFNGRGVGKGSGFDIDEVDLAEMEQCNGVVVASAIFGNYDIIQQPRNIADVTKKTTCFYMFLDVETEAYIKNSTALNNSKDGGLWRLVIVKNLPYNDARRNGKVPKLLLHRLFPNARYSLWIDGKLELVKDPYQILERFLWRKNVTFAISRHYRRFDVFEEAEANKVAGKYDNASIDYQIEFYKNEGLTHYSEAKLPITSDVPEGCVIIKEHIPVTNLFTCLWFNEVDRFTSRDQISFSTVRDRMMSQVNWRNDMFWDCERRNFVVQAYHKDLLEYMRLSIPPPPPPRLPTSTWKKLPPREVTDRTGKTSMKKSIPKRLRDRRSGSRRHRSRISNFSDKNSL